MLVDGNPLRNIRNTRRIVGVWKDGHAIDRKKSLDLIAKERKQKKVQLAATVRVISDFDEKLSSEFGAGWSGQTDGKSKSKIELASGGAKKTSKCLKVSGHVLDGERFFSGVWFAPGQKKFFTSDLSSHNTLSFWVRGKPATYEIMVFDRNLPDSSDSKEFQTTGTWKQFTFKLSDFKDCDGKSVYGLWFGGRLPGDFEFFLDEVELHK